MAGGDATNIAIIEQSGASVECQATTILKTAVQAFVGLVGVALVNTRASNVTVSVDRARALSSAGLQFQSTPNTRAIIGGVGVAALTPSLLSDISVVLTNASVGTMALSMFSSCVSVGGSGISVFGLSGQLHQLTRAAVTAVASEINTTTTIGSLDAFVGGLRLRSDVYKRQLKQPVRFRRGVQGGQHRVAGNSRCWRWSSD
jgi:hypothetical protein